MLELQQRTMIMALKSITIASEFIPPCLAGAFRFRTFPRFTIRRIISYDKFRTGFSQMHILELLSEDPLHIR
jgi:hypothetical protein